MHTQLSDTCATLRAVMRNRNSFLPGITTTFVRNWGEGVEGRETWSVDQFAIVVLVQCLASLAEMQA